MSIIYYYPNTNKAECKTQYSDILFKNVKIARDGNKLWLIDIDKSVILLETNNFTIISRYDEPGSDF